MSCNIYPYGVNGWLKCFVELEIRFFYFQKLFLLLTQITPGNDSKLLIKRLTLKVQENENRLSYFTDICLEDPQNPICMIGIL